MRNTRKIIALFVTCGLVAYVVAAVPLPDVLASYAALSVHTIALLTALSVATLVIGGVRLHALLKASKARHVTPRETAHAYISGLVSSLFLINIVGAMVGRYASLRNRGVTPETLALTFLTERLILLVVGLALFVAGWAYVLDTDAIIDSVRAAEIPQASLAILISTAVLMSGLGWHRLYARFLTLPDGRSIRLLLLAVGITIVGQGFMLATYGAAGASIGGVDVGFTEALAAGAIIAFAAALPISINGWGVREVTAIFVFGHLGIPASEAVAISVLIGLVSTVTVLLALPVFLVQRSPAQDKPPGANPALQSIGKANAMAKGADHSFRTFALVFGPLAVLLLFVTLHIPVGDTTVSLTPSDPIALLALVLTGLAWIAGRNLPLSLPTGFLFWLFGLTALIAFGFVLGTARFGVTEWALSNRLLGWFVILGYVSIGAMMVTALGRSGLRRLMEVVVVTGTVVTLLVALYRGVAVDLGLVDAVTGNFQGFSQNRNAFAFQLLIALAALLGFSQLYKRANKQWIVLALASCLIYGIYRTGSLTGLITLLVLLAVMIAMRAITIRLLVGCLSGAAMLVLLPGFAQTLWTLLLFPSENAQISTPQIQIILSSGSSMAERMLTIREGIGLWLSHPVFGAGLGAFANSFLGEDGRLLVIHSVPVWLLAEFGLVGFMVTASLPVWLAYRMFNTQPWNQRPYLVLLVGIGLVFLVFGLPHDIAYQRIFWVFTGALAAAWRLSTRRYSVSSA